MILAAGYGKRIHPLTLKIPKPLLKIGEETLLHNTIKFLELYGIKDVVINVHYLGEQIIDYMNERKFNLNVNIIKEKVCFPPTPGVLGAEATVDFELIFYHTEISKENHSANLLCLFYKKT